MTDAPTSEDVPQGLIPAFRPPPFCFSCGCSLSSSSDNESCGHPQDPVTWEPSRVGSVIEWKDWRRRTAVVVQGGRRPTVVLPNGTSKVISPDRLAKAQVVLDMSSVPSVLYRLETVAARPERWARGVKKWLDNQESAEQFLASTSDRRLYARSAIAAGDKESAEKSELTGTELSWLQMHAASAAGDHVTAVAIALDLPPDRYPDKIGVILAALAHSNWSPDQQQRTLLADLPESLPAAAVVKAAVSVPLRSREDVELGEVLGVDSESSESLWLKYLTEPIVSPSLPIEDAGEAAEGGLEDDAAQLSRHRLRGRLSRRAAGSDRKGSAETGIVNSESTLPERIMAARLGIELRLPSDGLPTLAAENLSVLDDLIDGALITVDGDPDLIPLSLKGRLDPASLSDEELHELNHDWERLRRAYEMGTLEDEQSDSDAFRHYSALHALRSGDTTQVDALLDPDGVLRAVATTIDTGRVDVRALSDPTTWDVLDHLVDGSHAEMNPEAASRWHANRAVDALFSWDWDAAVQAGKDALRAGRDENIRDEAMNIIAFAQFQLGQDEAAIAALERALEGEYTANLQANAGVVAEDMAPDRAAHHLGRLAAEAPTNDLRLAAVRRAFKIWSQSRPAWEEGDGEVVLPDELLNAMRSLSVADTPLDDHREIMRLLAMFDSEWASDPKNTEESPHRETWDHKLYVARAGGDPNAYIETLVSAVKANPDVQWVSQERDGFVESMRQMIFEDIENLGPAAYAYAAIEAGLPMEPFDRVTLTCGAVMNICRSLTVDKQEPSDAVYQHFATAVRAVDQLTPEQQELVDDLITFAGNSYAASVAIARNEVLQEGFNALNTLQMRLYGVPRYRVKWTELANSLRPMRSMCDDSIRTLTNARQHARNQEIAIGIDGLIAEFTRLRDFAVNPKSAF